MGCELVRVMPAIQIAVCKLHKLRPASDGDVVTVHRRTGQCPWSRQRGALLYDELSNRRRHDHSNTSNACAQAKSVPSVRACRPAALELPFHPKSSRISSKIKHLATCSRNASSINPILDEQGRCTHADAHSTEELE